jgi:hypothetical protein
MRLGLGQRPRNRPPLHLAVMAFRPRTRMKGFTHEVRLAARRMNARIGLDGQGWASAALEP